MKYLYLTLFTLLFACAYDKQIPQESKDTFAIEDEQQAQEEKPDEYEVVLDEEQAAKLNEEAEQAQPVIKDEVVEVQDRVFFNYDSAAVLPQAKEILDLQIQWLLNNPAVSITIEGHCDERGTREYNIALGERRAFAAKKYLTNNGVDSNRIKTISYGKERPAFFGNSREIHAKNRRAVVIEKQ